MHDEKAKVWSENWSCKYTHTSCTGYAARDKIDEDTAVCKEDYTKVFSFIVFNYFMHTPYFVTRLWESEKLCFMFTTKTIKVKSRNHK